MVAVRRVRGTTPTREDEIPVSRVRRVRAASIDEDGAQNAADEAEDDGEAVEIEDSPDVRQEGETEKEAGDRIEAKYRARATSPLKAIRAFCVICMGCYPREVAKCTATQCVLYPFRYGRNPFQKHERKK